MSDAYEMRVFPPTAAARLELVMSLLRGLPVVDDDGNVVGYGPPLISAEDARRLLDAIPPTPASGR